MEDKILEVENAPCTFQNVDHQTFQAKLMRLIMWTVRIWTSGLWYGVLNNTLEVTKSPALASSCFVACCVRGRGQWPHSENYLFAVGPASLGQASLGDNGPGVAGPLHCRYRVTAVGGFAKLRNDAGFSQMLGASRAAAQPGLRKTQL